jgi:carbon storage regulator
MLVLSRKTQESVVVGGSDRFERMLKVTVLEIKGEKVRLGFEADADVPVHRSEVWERIVAGGLPRGPTARCSPPDPRRPMAHPTSME